MSVDTFFGRGDASKYVSVELPYSRTLVRAQVVERVHVHELKPPPQTTFSRTWLLRNREGGAVNKMVVRRGDCWLSEPGALFAVDVDQPKASMPVNKFISYIQIVGDPMLRYSQGEKVEVNDEQTGEWIAGSITTVNENHYVVKTEGD